MQSTILATAVSRWKAVAGHGMPTLCFFILSALYDVHMDIGRQDKQLRQCPISANQVCSQWGIVQAEVLAKVSKVQKEKDFLQQTSESLLRNQDDFRTQLAAQQAAVRAKDAQITDLTEQVSAA